MENAIEALKIAFAVFIFVIAITLTFNFIAQAKNTSDVVLYYADNTNFYDYADSSSKNRTVEIAEVISTLYRYYKESISVTVDLGSNSKVKTFDLAISNINTNEIKSELEEYIKENLLKLDSSKYKFTEEFVEVPISGMYVTGEDNTTITTVSGGSKLYITYTLQS